MKGEAERLSAVRKGSSALDATSDAPNSICARMSAARIDLNRSWLLSTEGNSKDDVVHL